MNVLRYQSLSALLATTGVALAFYTVTPNALALHPDHHRGSPHSHPHGNVHHDSHAHAHVDRHVDHHVAVHRGPGRPMARHGYRALPVGARPYVYGGHRFYRNGGRYYYPYFYGGRTVYLDVDLVGGVPVVPDLTSIQVNF